MEFSGAVKLTDLSDFLAPSQACVKPMMQPKLIKTTDRATATVSLSDCLACSGCVTSAETVLLQEQSLSKVLEALSHKRVVVSLSEQTLGSLSHRFGFSVKDTYGKITNVLKSLGVAEVKDMQYAKELALRTSAEEFITRFREGNTLICSECPGWICYAEKKADPTIIPMLSNAKSPMLVQDLLVKTEDPACAHVCVLPCFDKKLEGVRVEDGPLVLTTRELEEWLRSRDFQQAKIDLVPDVFSEGGVFTSSHGYAEFIFVQAAEILYQKRVSPADLELELTQEDGSVLLRFLVATGFQNIQNVVRMLKKGSSGFHYIELMACPMGCMNGGGQMQVSNTRVEVPLMLETLKRTESATPQIHTTLQLDPSNLHIQWKGLDRPMSLRW